MYFNLSYFFCSFAKKHFFSAVIFLIVNVLSFMAIHQRLS